MMQGDGGVGWWWLLSVSEKTRVLDVEFTTHLPIEAVLGIRYTGPSAFRCLRTHCTFLGLQENQHLPLLLFVTKKI